MIDKSALARITDVANQLAWKEPKLDVLRHDLMSQYSALALTLQKHIKASDKRGKLVLPDLRAFSNEEIAIFSDYSGEGSGSYHTYSFLVCAWSLTGAFHERMKHVRADTGLGDKEVAFKDFRMGQLRRALPEYLRLLDAVPGFLFTLVVDKRLTTLFGPSERETHERLVSIFKEHGLGDWKPHVAEELARIVHIGAFLTGLLSKSGQKVLWMSDNDAICANETMHHWALELFRRVLSLYTEPDCAFSMVAGRLRSKIVTSKH